MVKKVLALTIFANFLLISLAACSSSDGLVQDSSAEVEVSSVDIEAAEDAVEESESASSSGYSYPIVDTKWGVQSWPLLAFLLNAAW